MKPLVTIITVVLNGRDALERTICSVLAQEYHPIEYLVVDGGSIDGTVDIIRAHAHHIAWTSSEPDSGIYDAMNKGIRRASGEAIAVLNAGDWYEPDAVRHIMDHRPRFVDTSVGYAISGARMLWAAGGQRIATIMPTANYQRDIYWGLPITHGATFVARSLYEMYGLYDTSYRSAADLDFFLRLYTRAGIVPHCIPSTVLNTVAGGMSYSFTGILESTRIAMKHGAPPHVVAFSLVYKILRRLIAQAVPYGPLRSLYRRFSSRYAE